MTVIPVSFTEHKAMLGHAKMIFEKGYVSNQDKLITSLRTAVENEGILDKVITSYDDIFDAFRLALRFYSLIGETPNEQH
ncbi:MAG: hypothetical protein QN716_12510 [Nitrososphaeraceae archaeon]|jgi:hypothetical protein|nr:hypothetical protein [Nitrososphaeraceae archaeon]MDW0333870.1 hypothetical protein [Nitrososphaeraceae archaeon]